MEDTVKHHSAHHSESFMQKYSIAIVSGVILVVFLIGLSFLNSFANKKDKSEVVFPAGVNYLGDGNQAEGEVAPTQAPNLDFDALVQSQDWVELVGRQYAYSFQYPRGLTPLFFPNDPNDSVTFQVGNIPAELNIMFVVETVSSRDRQYVGNLQGFVSNYWRFFGGLSGVQSVEPFTNDNGLKGYRAVYTTKTGEPTTAHIFLAIPDDADHVLHVANIFPSETLFDRIVNSVNYKK